MFHFRSESQINAPENAGLPSYHPRIHWMEPDCLVHLPTVYPPIQGKSDESRLVFPQWPDVPRVHQILFVVCLPVLFFPFGHRGHKIQTANLSRLWFCRRPHDVNLIILRVLEVEPGTLHLGYAGRFLPRGRQLLIHRVCGLPHAYISCFVP
jgi:hypothetical protein